MKVNGYEVDVWYEWYGHDECPVPDGYKYQVMFRGSREVYDMHSECGDLRWDHKGSLGDIVNFKIVVDEPSEMIIDDHMNPRNSKWGECSLTSEELERIRVTAPKAYREIDRLVGVIEELREISH